MKTTAKEFRNNPNKSITLLGMSGVGKTSFGSKLSRSTWFHYSGDYRIGTRYLDEAIIDEVKRHAMQSPYLKELLLTDSIFIRNNITFDDLHLLSYFLGKMGNSELGGLSVDEFKRRQALFRDAEIKAMADVPAFIEKARNIYGYPHFLNDAGGSICGLTDDECWNSLGASSVVLYLHASDKMEQTLLNRARAKPKPLFYENEFLDQHLADYLEEKSLSSAEQITPDDFVQWVFPALVKYRKPQYERIAAKHGHVIEADKILELRDEKDIIDLVCESIGT